jgi:hypothetical protein
MEILSKFWLPGLGLLLTLLSGFWLSSLGKPLNTLVFTVHKLIALAAVVLSVMELVKWMKAAPPAGLLTGLLVLAGLCVLSLFVSGALMSAGKLSYPLMLNVHRGASLLAVFSLVGAAVVLFGRNG